ncbi:hypothetical protein [Moorella sp. E306M]|uniref:hypothetical protein n=1 Tax=Moorella sp. E306M TaxID=2572683 RepID=UPI0010FFC025|nr:hypothetical protein [Moorella sp. E306M]GEA17042.1 hypothetical protein E306M_01760 [Moorella sp. E306M]
MGRIVYLTNIGHNGRIQLPRKVLDELKWKEADSFKIEVIGQDKVEIKKVKK